jgi:hypothetical protein
MFTPVVDYYFSAGYQPCLIVSKMERLKVQSRFSSNWRSKAQESQIFCTFKEVQASLPPPSVTLELFMPFWPAMNKQNEPSNLARQTSPFPFN